MAAVPAAAQQAAQGGTGQATQPRPAPKAAPKSPAASTPGHAPKAAPKGTPDGDTKTGADAQPSAPEAPAPPYERDILRLSEVMGALAFLRGLCGAGDAPQWHAQMTALLDAEATTPARRERLAGSYNRGYRGFALTYRSCTPSARAAIERYLAEGASLASTIAGRFGG